MCLRVFIHDTKSSKFCDIMQFILSAVVLFFKYLSCPQIQLDQWGSLALGRYISQCRTPN